MARVAVANVNKLYGVTQVLFDVSLEVADGEFAVFVGPSGCGKSTMLRAIAGLEDVASGRIEIGEDDVTSREPSERGVAMVFQSYALYPHMTVQENMEFGLKVNGVPAAERRTRVAEAARILQLADYMDRRPGQLSGGQRQRVAIGRAIVKQPRVFLFDEPLSNLDAKLRIQMRVELETLHSDLGATMIYVTHDQVEAMTMADKIVVLNGGRIEQVGPPMELYHRPRTAFVAGFIGAPSMNFLDVAAADGGVRYAGIVLPAHGDPRVAPVQLGIRPEHLRVGAPGSGQLDARVEVKEQLGGESFLYVRTTGGDRLVVKVDGDDPTGAGADVGLELPVHRTHLFDADGVALTS
ncbi:MAG: sn-glycerol-3-phosphate ABC transporter ATP-binding protein UgpC [Pseudomonadota bacterium]